MHLFTPYHQRCWLSNWTLITHWKASLLFSLEDTASVISNKNVKFGLKFRNLVKFGKSILNEPWLTGHNDTSGPCSHMAFFLHDRALVCICRWHLRDCAYQQWFLEVFLGLFINVNDRIMPMSDAASSEGLKTTDIQQRFLQFLWIFW